jgi:chromosome segregation ATPase
METKSRYEVIAELEAKKRTLIQERDALNDEVNSKERNIKNLEREKENIETQKTDFQFRQDKARQNLENEKKDFDFKIGNTLVVVEREIADAKEDLEYFKTTIQQKKATKEVLIKSVDESLARFNTLTK